ncbi:hypothetical protein EXIGLDRAFT_766756 [Exidia glandulosa HHB12029]|uniref:Uncharacterized protein n=1 Tax=Exidia glandulosa HHB12029 TaxID=1314781 RepID=A0A165JIA2_EXIGL|nr:hypothetical protein EXIGLDRAFT_766756 [Exidia glandulosa HHB12029]
MSSILDAFNEADLNFHEIRILDLEHAASPGPGKRREVAAAIRDASHTRPTIPTTGPFSSYRRASGLQSPVKGSRT